MKKILCIVFTIALLAGCAARKQEFREHGHTPIVRSGVLQMGLVKKAFTDAWGDPDRTATVATAEFVKEGWTGGSGSRIFKGSRTLVIWSYDKIGVDLAFSGSSLVGWKTEKTVEELKAFAKPAPDGGQ